MHKLNKTQLKQSNHKKHLKTVQKTSHRKISTHKHSHTLNNRSILQTQGKNVFGKKTKHISQKSFASSSKNEFKYLDPLNITSQLTDEELMIQDTARAFAKEELAPVIKDWYRQESFDPKIMKRFGEAGLLGPHLTGYGCAGVSVTSYGLIAREIERVDSGFRSAMSVQSSLVMYPIHAYANDDVKQQYLPGLAKGEIIGAFGLTEPDHGSNPSGMTTNAIKDDNNDYILNGTKTWITNSPHADVLIVWAKDKSNDNKISGFVVDAKAPGVTTPKIEGKLSLRASTTGQIILENVKVPKTHKLNILGLKGPFSCLNSARLGIAWGVLGASEFCIEQTREYVLNREQFGEPLGHKQLPQFKLGDMVSELGLAQVAALQVTRLKENGLDTPEMVSLIKRNNCLKSLQIARTCRDMLGGNGISDEYHVIRHMVNLETVNTYEGTADIHALILGRAITGAPSF